MTKKYTEENIYDALKIMMGLMQKNIPFKVTCLYNTYTITSER